jgi:chromosome segregation ATPase
MTRFLTRSLKYSVVLVLVLVSAGAIFGPGRVQEVLRYLKATAVRNVDGMIPDEVKLRNDIEKLREEYPRRIAELKSMLNELSRGLQEMEEDRGLCREVLALCDEDLGQLRPGAGAQGTAPPALPARIEFRGASFSHEEALERGRKVLEIKDLYEARLKSATASVDLLQSEREALSAELGRLRREYDGFIAQYRGLEREIDLLKHNQRLIEIACRRERLDRLDPASWLRSLDSIKAAIERRKTEQQERLRGFKSGNPVAEYETRARVRAL